MSGLQNKILKSFEKRVSDLGNLPGLIPDLTVREAGMKERQEDAR